MRPMKEHSLDLREQIVDAVESGVGTKRDLAKFFGVHESFIYKLLRQQRELGNIAPLPRGGGAAAKLKEHHLIKLTELVAGKPDATLDELRERMQKKARVTVSIATIWRGLEALGLSRKKSPSATTKLTQQSGPRSTS